MGSHKYGHYLHILTPAGADGAHGGPQPWEGITGRVKQLLKEDTKKLMGEIMQSNAANAANQQAIKGVEAAMNTRIDANKQAIKGVEAQLGDMQSKLEGQLHGIEEMLSALLDKQK